jgi:uncharacterized repeat protein (TIGR01451 family)
MENQLLKTTLTNKNWLNYKKISFIFASIILLFAGQIANAQKVPTNGGSPAGLFVVSSEDATTATSNNAKLKVTGALTGGYRVGFVAGVTYTPGGANQMGGTVLYSSLAPATYLSSTLTTPSTTGPDETAGRAYTIRVVKADSSLYYDIPYTLPYVNFYSTPKFPDISVKQGASQSTGLVAGVTIVTDTVTIRNDGNLAATNVKVTVGLPTSLTYQAGTYVAPAGTTYDPVTGIWTIGTMNIGDVKKLTFQVKVAAAGVSYITAYTTQETETDLDSSPTVQGPGEDDDSIQCLQSSFSSCNGDIYKISLPFGHYKNKIQWTKDGVLIPWGSPPSGVVVNADSSLSITTTGVFSWNYIGACAGSACCPITIINGTKPSLKPLVNQTICFAGTFTRIATNDYNKNSYVPAIATTYQWFNNNGTNNPITTSIAGQTDSVLTALPTAVGVYKYYVLARRGGINANCRDSSLITLTIKDKGVLVTTVPIAYCQNSPAVALTASGTSGSILNWYADATTTALTVPNPPIPSTATVGIKTYYVSQTNGLGCESDRTPLVVTVNSLPTTPTITGNTNTYCQGDTPVALTAQASGSNALLWSNGGAYGTAVPPVITTNPGLQVFTVLQKESSTGCISAAYASIPVTVNPKPTAAIVTVPATCVGNTPQNNGKLALNGYHSDDKVVWNYGATLTATPPGAVIPAANNGVFATNQNNLAAATPFQVLVTNSFGCTLPLSGSMPASTCVCTPVCEPATIKLN